LRGERGVAIFPDHSAGLVRSLKFAKCNAHVRRAGIGSQIRMKPASSRISDTYRHQ
jgi:hypothetical protein